MRSRNFLGGARLALALPTILAALAFATIAAAESVPQVMSATEADTGTGGQPYLTMMLPNNVSAGQLLVAAVAIQPQFANAANPWATILPPYGGWVEIAPTPRTCGNDLAVSISYRIAQPTDTAGTRFTWGFVGGGFINGEGYLTPMFGSGGIVSIANANTTSPISQISSLCTMDSTQATAQPLTTLGSNNLNMLVFAITGDNFLSPPSGYSQPFQNVVTGIGPDLAVDSKVIPASLTNTGYQISNASQAGDNFGYQILVNPAASSPSVVKLRPK